MNSREAIRNRLIKYLIPVILLSVTFNIPKFMEAQLVYRLVEPVKQTVPNSTTPDPSLNMTLPTMESTPEANVTQKWIPMVRTQYIHDVLIHSQCKLMIFNVFMKQLKTF